MGGFQEIDQLSQVGATTITELLSAWHKGDDSAFTSLIPAVYGQLRRLAARYMRHERPEHTFAPTDLVHTAFLHMPGFQRIEWNGRHHFYAISALLMRRLLVDHANRRSRRQSAETESLQGAGDDTSLLLAVDEALRELGGYDPELATIVEMKFFGGFNVQDVARAVGLSEATVKRRWKTAKGLLHEKIVRR